MATQQECYARAAHILLEAVIRIEQERLDAEATHEQVAA
jgi:hypothetical protein